MKREEEKDTIVKMWQVNAQYEMQVVVPSPHSQELISLPGVPGKGQPLDVYMIEPKFGDCDLLPTGNVIDILKLPDG